MRWWEASEEVWTRGNGVVRRFRGEKNERQQQKEGEPVAAAAAAAVAPLDAPSWGGGLGEAGKRQMRGGVGGRVGVRVRAGR
jgi:hypothetical protein